MRTPLLAAILFLAFPSAQAQSAKEILGAFIQEPLPEDGKICGELIRGQQRPLESVKSSVAPKPAEQLARGWAALGDACEILARGGAGDFRSVASERWRFGQKTIRAALEGEQSPGAGGARATPAAATNEIVPKIIERSRGRAKFAYSKDMVWGALMESLTDANFSPQTMDKDSGTVFFQSDQQWGRAWGDANYAVSLLTTKKVARMSTWQAIAAKANIFCKALDEQTTEVRINVSFAGCNGWQSFGTDYPCIWEPLETNGHAENLIFDGIEKRLAERPSATALVPAAVADAKVVEDAERVLMAFQRLASAIELGLGRDELLRYLVDARAGIDLFAASPSSGAVPMFTAAMREAGSLYQAALNGPDDRRAASLSAAHHRNSDAKMYLANYRIYVQEPSPK